MTGTVYHKQKQKGIKQKRPIGPPPSPNPDSNKLTCYLCREDKPEDELSYDWLCKECK